jgi:predicted transcriptional regulator YheO
MALNLTFYKQLARALARQFGDNCEIVLHDLTSDNIEHSVVLVENGHVTHRTVGDGPSHVVLETLKNHTSIPEDHLAYLTKTSDGRILRSSTIYIPDEANRKVAGILSINYDITGLLMAEQSIKSLTSNEEAAREPEHIPQNVNDLLDDLIYQSVELVGKPVAMMTKDDKVRAIQFLNDAGAFLITKSGDKISSFFGISKYTLYSYIDVNK